MDNISRRYVTIGICGIVFGLMSLGVCSHICYAATTPEGTVTAKKATSRSGAKRANTINLSDSEQLMRKIDEVLANQKTILSNEEAILQRFDAVMEELRVIKVRATRQGG